MFSLLGIALPCILQCTVHIIHLSLDHYPVIVSGEALLYADVTFKTGVIEGSVYSTIITGSTSHYSNY